LDVIDRPLKILMSQYINLLVEWKESYSTEQHAQWGKQARLIRDALVNYVNQMGALTKSERQFFAHWIKLCIINPKWGTEV
ncbi:MAG: hypothetical protein ACREIQ_06060, partial [Nitrospiria bacterium]